jgi:ESF2/ABP1 family protein
MAPEKRNEFLDASDSEDDRAGGYDSEEEISKGGRSAKRRRLSEADEHDRSDDDLASDVELDEQGNVAANEEEPSEKAAKASKKAKPDNELPDVTRPLTKKNLVASDAAVKKSGVVYLSRIPPFMKPIKLRSLLEPYGTINRIFLAPEDPAAHARRVKAGGNKKRSYTEGWVEFVNKKEAKAVSELLNARTIGGKKGGYYRDDIWNLIYLKGFKWNNLTEQITAENAERTSRMRAEISKTTRENKDFVRNIERAKMLDGIQAKTKKRKASEGDDRPQEGARTFKQVPQVRKDKDAEQPESVTRVLSKIF